MSPETHRHMSTGEGNTMEAVHETQVGPLYARVYQDEDPWLDSNPRKNYDNLGTISWWGSFDSRMGALEDETLHMRECPFCETWTHTAAEHCPACGGAEELPPSFGDDVVIPLDVFEDWLPRLSIEPHLRDARGAIHVSRARIAEEYGAFTPATAKLARRVLRAEVAEYKAFLQGEVYFWRVETAAGDVLDAVHGYIGEDDYALTEAVSTAQWHIQQMDAEAAEAAYWAARDVDTID